jgi:hypothetical protein
VLQIVIAAKPNSASRYAELAEYAYKAKNVRLGDLASEKAVSLSPAAQRPQLKTQLAQIKKEASAPTKASAPAVGSGSGGTITVGGKTYPIKPSTKK